MDTTLLLLIAFAATFLAGLVIGFMSGVAKGLVLGARFRTGRPASPLPWILCFVASGGFLLAAAATTVYSTWFLSAGIRTTATVNEIIERKDDDGKVSRTTRYTYRDSAGTSHTGETSLSGGRPSAAGDAIPVRYLRDSPGKSRIDTFLHHWFAPIFLAGWSIFAWALGIGLRWWRGREQQWAEKRLLAAGPAPGA